MDNLKIDIIIPAYNAQSTLSRCLSSIAMQTIADDIKVTIVDDASTNSDYSKILNVFSNLIDIQILRYEENSGPGVARQYGIDHTSNPLMAFADADDTFADAFAFQQLRSVLINNPNATAVWSKFIEETTTGELITHEIAPVWMFGKLYRRSFWEENNIRFHPKSRYNEDTGVNSIIYLLNDPENKPLLYANQLITYYWHNNKNTITKTNNNAQYYWDDRGFYGFVQNRLWTIAHVYDRLKNNSEFNSYIVQGLMFMYCYYNSAFNNKSYMLKDIVPGIILYYDRYAKYLLQFLTDDKAAEMLKTTISNSNSIMYNITWKEFLYQIETKTLGNNIDFCNKELDESLLYPENYM